MNNKQKRQKVYDTYIFYQRLIKSLEGTPRFLQSCRKSINDDLRYLNSQEPREKIDKKYNRGIEAMRKRIELLLLLMDIIVIVTYKKIIKIAKKRKSKLNNQLKELGDPRTQTSD